MNAIIGNAELSGSGEPDPEPHPQTHRGSFLERAFDVLDCFNGHSEMTVSGVCRQTGLPPATAHRILSALVKRGAIERTSYGRYCLGTPLWKLAAGSPQWLRLRELAQPYLVELHLRTRATTYFVIRDGWDGIHTDRITRVKITNPGIISAVRRRPLYHSGAGRVILAYTPTSQRELTERAKTDTELAGQLPAVLEQLRTIRASGVSVATHDNAPDRTTIAAPVFDVNGNILASLAVAFPVSRINDPTPLVPKVIGAARLLTVDVGRYASEIQAESPI